MIAQPLRLSIEMLSDWHIGTGGGHYGALDSRVTRDSDGFPFIPASTLKGMLRDAAETVASALDQKGNGPWAQFAARLFGNQPVVEGQKAHSGDRQRPVSGVVHFSSARLSPVLRERIFSIVAEPSRERLVQAMTFAKPGVKIDRDSGTAAEDMLRFDEIARRGLRFEAEITLALSDTHEIEAAEALLAAACFVLERIGGKRRRGLGRVQVSLNGSMRAGDYRKRLEGQPPEAERVELEQGSGGDLTNACEPKDDAWTTIDVEYRLLEPLLAAGRIEGNVITSLSYLPGSLLLPAIKRMLRVQGDVDQAIFAGDIRVLPAYPAGSSDTTIVAPACFERPKNPPDPEASEISVVGEEAAEQSNAQRKSLGNGFLSYAGKALVPVRTQKMMLTHNTIDDERQRPTSAIGGIYVYEALAKDQLFRGQVKIRSSLVGDEEDLVRSLSGQVRIGRARTSGYGRVATTAVLVDDSNLAVKSARECKGFDLFFHTDAILRDDSFAPAANFEAVLSALDQSAGVALSAVCEHAATRSFIRAATVEGFSIAAGLPRPAFAAVGAGSVIKFRFTKPVKNDFVAKLAEEGLGERKAEGFGTVSVNPAFLAEAQGMFLYPAIDCSSYRQKSGSAGLKGRESEAARRIEIGAWRQAILEAIELVVADRDLFKSLFGFECGHASKPSNAMLGRIRSTIFLAPEERRAEALMLILRRQRRQRDVRRDGGASDEMREKLGQATADKFWQIASGAALGIGNFPDRDVMSWIESKMEAPPGDLGGAGSVRAQLSSWASTALILAGLQLHVLQQSEHGDKMEVADGA